MYTSFLSLSLLLAPLANVTPAWHTSYAVAIDVGQKHGKPVAVFVGTGPKGLSGLVKEGELPEEAYRLLAERYVCVYLDQTNGGHKLARDLGITQGRGVVISDRSGTYQAYQRRAGSRPASRRGWAKDKGYHLASVPFPWSVIPQAEWAPMGSPIPKETSSRPSVSSSAPAPGPDSTPECTSAPVRGNS